MGFVKGLLQHVMAMDLSTKDIKLKVSSLFNLSESEATALILRARSELNKESVRSHEKKIIFLPQCIRKKGCTAVLGERGFECRLCSEDCQVYKIRKMTSLPCYIVPGGSMVAKILEQEKPCAAIGIACLKELELGVAGCDKNRIPAVVLPLLNEGCINTLVDLGDASKLLKEVSDSSGEENVVQARKIEKTAERAGEP